MAGFRRRKPPRARAGRCRSYTVAGRPIEPEKLGAGLYLVATPIGNLGDITLRALEVLAAVDVIACEDTRVTRKLLEHYGIATPLTPYHEHNAALARPKLAGAARRRRSARARLRCRHARSFPIPATSSRAQAREAGHAVTALPGPSAVLAALAGAGLPTDRFLFAGFLPPKQGSAAPASPNSRPFRQRSCCSRPARGSLPRLPISPKGSERDPPPSAASSQSSTRRCAAATLRHLPATMRPVRRDARRDRHRHRTARREPDGRGELDDLLRQALGRVSVKDAVAGAQHTPLEPVEAERETLAQPGILSIPPPPRDHVRMRQGADRRPPALRDRTAHRRRYRR